MKRQFGLTFSLLSTLLCSAAYADSAPDVTGFKGVSTLGWTVHHGDPAEEKDEQSLRKTVPDLMSRHQYAALDGLAESIRTKKQYARGRTAISIFYEQLALTESATEEDWKSRLKDLNQWWIQYPDSKTAPAALVDYWAAYAWKARGTGYADTVSADSWQIFSERLAQGAQVFEKAKTKKSVCPKLYSFAQRIALGQSWDRAEYDKLVDEAVKKFPGRSDYYFHQVYYLQPRWHGGATEWADYAGKLADRTGGADGDKLYARLAWSILSFGLYDNIMTEFPNLKWSRIDKGLQAILTEYPDSINTQSIRLRFAILANQNTLAKQLLSKLGKNIDIHTWQKKVYFFKTRAEVLSK